MKMYIIILYIRINVFLYNKLKTLAQFVHHLQFDVYAKKGKLEQLNNKSLPLKYSHFRVRNVLTCIFFRLRYTHFHFGKAENVFNAWNAAIDERKRH